MIDAQLTSRELTVVLSGKDAWLYALRPRWKVAVPLEHVRQASVGQPAGAGVKRYSGGNGGHGGTMTAARRTGPTVVIDLDGDPFARMRLSVADPDGMVAAITETLRARNQ